MLLSVPAATLASGCPENSCFLKICNGKNCHCSISSCSEGAGFDTKQNRCRCLKGYFDVAGQCLDQGQANAYCGLGYGWAQTGCVQLQCKPGDELDLQSGWCTPKEQIAAQTGVSVGEGQKLACGPGEKLVVDAGKAACVPQSQSCAKDEVWNGQQCLKTQTCPTGSAWDVSRGQCVAYAQGTGSDELVVNVDSWMQTTYGVNGGAGSPGFCSSFAKKPYGFGLGPGTSAMIRVQLIASFAGNEIGKGQIQTIAAYDMSGTAVPAKGAADVQSGAMSSFLTLVVGGGRASVASAQTTVKCAVTNATKPVSVPATGGV